MPEQHEATEGYKMRPESPKPLWEVFELTSYESYELAEVTAAQDSALRAKQRADGRMNQLAWKVLKASGKEPASLEGWDFHIDGDSKRVVLRREVEKAEAGGIGPGRDQPKGLKPGDVCGEPAKWALQAGPKSPFQHACLRHVRHFVGAQHAIRHGEDMACEYVEPTPDRDGG